MARKLRVEYPGAVYHVMSRGNRKETVFLDEEDYAKFIRTLEEACEKTHWQIHAFCLMPNHFHLVVETPQADLVAGMKWLLGTYTNRFNRKHQTCGHLFSGRYKALIVDGSGNGYLRSVCDYVHLNPVRAKMIRDEQPIEDFPWSSYPMYLKTAGQRPPWLRTDRVCGEMRIPSDSQAGRREFQRIMEMRRQEENPDRWTELRQSWIHGSPEFKGELLQQINAKRGIQQYGKVPLESVEQRAIEVVRAELEALDWSEEVLIRKKKTDPDKISIAQRLRRETTMPLKWIANRLKIGSVNTLRNALYQAKLSSTSKTAPKPTLITDHPAKPPSRTESFSISWD